VLFLIDRSGSITAAELQHLAFNSRPIGFNIAHKLVAVFDKDRSGSIDFMEYATLHSFLSSMQQAFAAADLVCVFV
jgi:peflin